MVLEVSVRRRMDTAVRSCLNSELERTRHDEVES